MSLNDEENKRKKISEEVVAQIKKNGIKMKSSNQFMILSLVWFGLGAIFFVASLILLAFAVHYLSEYEFFGIISRRHFSGWVIVPLVMIVFSVFLIYLSSRFYRKGRLCCRHEEWMLLFVIGLVALFGLFVMARIDSFKNWREAVEEHHMMQGYIISANGFWSKPEQGRIFGEVINVNKEGEYILVEGQNGESWRVHTEDCDCEINHQTAEEGGCLKLIGRVDNDDFRAREIWDCE
jgi:membrane protein YdbS with pleckstrin-like domain